MRWKGRRGLKGIVIVYSVKGFGCAMGLFGISLVGHRIRHRDQEALLYEMKP